MILKITFDIKKTGRFTSTDVLWENPPPDFSGFFHFYAKGVAVGADMVENVKCSA